MKKIKILFLFIVFFIFFSKPILSKENKILLKLNNEIITSVDILNEIKYLTILNSNFSSIAKKEKIKIAKNSLIRQKVKNIEIKKYKKNLEIEDNIFENIIKNYFFNLQIEKNKDFNFFFKKRFKYKFC